MQDKLHLQDEAATRAAGIALGRTVGDAGGVITLRGELGAGKTTLARGLIEGLGYSGPVVSPTYTLLEPYTVGGRTVVHLDLYRLADAEEIALLGLRDLDPQQDLILVEWPERGAGMLPPVDLALSLEDEEGRRGRWLSGGARSTTGDGWWQALLAGEGFT